MKKNIMFFLSAIFFLLMSSSNSYSKNEWHKIEKIIDGDTVITDTGIVIRYQDINTPETAHHGNFAELYADEAKAFNSKLVLGKKVKINDIMHTEDRFGRKLAFVWLESGKMINEILLEEGYAYFLYEKDQNNDYAKKFLEIQKKAISDSKGMWKQMPLDKQINLVGNSKSKRFHLQSCKYGQKISKKNKVIFNNMREGFQEGYAPCRTCLPLNKSASYMDY